MKSFNFRLSVIIRILLIIVLGYGAFYAVAQTTFWLMGFWFILFAFLIFIDLIRFVEKSNRELGHFLLAIQQNDFSNIYPETGKNRQNLHHVFNIITREFKKVRSEKESNFHFFKTLVEHSGVPLLAYSESDEQITLVNEGAKELLKSPHITKIDSLKRISEDIFQAVRNLESDEKVLIKTEMEDELFHLSISAKELFLQAQKYKVVSFHNINSELDQKEIESWQKLIRVMTHEIKNSVIPISTLAEVANQLMVGKDGKLISLKKLNDEDEDDLRTSLSTIEKRSKGLVRFVTSYGDLAKVPKPQLEDCDLREVVNQIISLELPEAEKRNIKIVPDLASGPVPLNLDPQMIEQVLINLIKNAIETLENTANGLIQVTLAKINQSVSLVVQDNGPGMDKETLDNIFVPFYTTKEKGSGIGLSLSRQIIRAHKGSLKAWSKPGEGARFEILL